MTTTFGTTLLKLKQGSPTTSILSSLEDRAVQVAVEVAADAAAGVMALADPDALSDLT